MWMLQYMGIENWEDHSVFDDPTYILKCLGTPDNQDPGNFQWDRELLLRDQYSDENNVLSNNYRLVKLDQKNEHDAFRIHVTKGPNHLVNPRLEFWTLVAETREDDAPLIEGNDNEYNRTVEDYWNKYPEKLKMRRESPY